MLQFLRELHFIEAIPALPNWVARPCCSSFGSCTSLRRPSKDSTHPGHDTRLQFLRELHFIEAQRT